MSKRKKSNLLSWIWFVAAIPVLLVGIAARPWAFAALGVSEKFLWEFMYLAGVAVICRLMMRIAKSYDEDDSPVEAPAPKFAAEQRNARLCNAFSYAGLVIFMWPSLWDDFAASPLPPRVQTAYSLGAIILFSVSALIHRRSERQSSINPPAPIPDAKSG
ncbi:MAG: hypothetical protein EXS05_07380 [Planctomycetaceae bacterium]|nr:hypothetical protein [Planctomycetaceae bacterium]